MQIMWKRRRIWFALLVVVILTVAGLYESITHVGRGWLRGEAFYQGRPTSYWAEEIQQWEFQPGSVREQIRTDYFYESYERRPGLPYWAYKFIPRSQPQWPRLFDGDPNGADVLRELLQHSNDDVRDWARRALERIDTDDDQDRGPCKKLPMD
jgi:hypothetical protein